MKIEVIEWDTDDLSDLMCPDTVYKAQRQKAGIIDVVYIFWSGKELRCCGARHDAESLKHLGDATDNSFLMTIHQALDNGEDVGVPIKGVVSNEQIH